MLTPPAENRKRKEKEMLFRLQAESKSLHIQPALRCFQAAFFQLAPEEAVLI